jgi:hypothetical protein
MTSKRKTLDGEFGEYLGKNILINYIPKQEWDSEAGKLERETENFLHIKGIDVWKGDYRYNSTEGKKRSISKKLISSVEFYKY